MAVFGGANLEYMMCKEDGANGCDGFRWSLCIRRISWDSGHIGSKLYLVEYPMNFPTSMGIPILRQQWKNQTQRNQHL